MSELTDEQIAQEKEFLQGIPRVNLAAFLLPPIWGPAHGMWATILFYPLWLFADNTFYAAWTQGNALSVVIALILGLSLTVGTFAFALIAQPFAYHRAVSRGVSKHDYLKHQRIWAIVSVVLGAVMLVLATYYNLEIRPFLSEW